MFFLGFENDNILSSKSYTVIKIERDESEGVFLTAQNCVFLGFENDNILRSKSYIVTKSGISSQRTLGSLQNLKLRLIRH